MAAEYTLTPELAAAVVRLVRRELSEHENPDAGHRRQAPANESESLQGFLAADLDAADDEKTDPATALLDVWYRDPVTQDLLDAGRQVLVTNRYTDFHRSEGDYLIVFWIEGEWRPHMVRGGGGAVMLAALDQDLCAGDLCANVRCVVGTTDLVVKAANPLALSGQLDDPVAIVAVPHIGEGYAECEAADGCPDLPATEDCEEEDCEEVRTTEGNASWVIIQVKHKAICLVPEIALEPGGVGQKCLLYGQAHISAMYCEETVCAKSAGDVADIDPTPPEGGYVDCSETAEVFVFDDLTPVERCCEPQCCPDRSELILTFKSPGCEFLDEFSAVLPLHTGRNPGPQIYENTIIQIPGMATCLSIGVHLECLGVTETGTIAYRMTISEAGEASCEFTGPSSIAIEIPDCAPLHMEFGPFTVNDNTEYGPCCCAAPLAYSIWVDE